MKTVQFIGDSVPIALLILALSVVMLTASVGAIVCTLLSWPFCFVRNVASRCLETSTRDLWARIGERLSEEG
jgi:hypothetical protein